MDKVRSHIASNLRRRRRQRTPCPICGELKYKIAKYCRNCSYKFRKMPLRKGGRARHSEGYVLIKNASHHRADKRGYVLEHIIIWEQGNDKLLPSGWIIHHLNGIKDDNRLPNLVALSNKRHHLILQVKARRIQELEAMLKNQGQLL